MQPPPPVDTGRRFLLTSYKHIWIADVLYVEIRTDVPCHLYLRWTDKPLRMHNRSTTLGGYYFMTDPKYCFVEWRQIEQNEDGDTLVHTFDFPEWGECLTRWWGFVGTVEEQPSPSATSIFTAHYGDYKEAEKLTVYFTRPVVQSTDDAHRRWGMFSTNRDALEYGFLTGDYRYAAGFRFQDVPLEPDTPLRQALVGYRAAKTSGDTWIRLMGQRDPDPQTFSTLADFLARPRTYVIGRTPFPRVVNGNWYNIDVTDIVREIIALPGWKAHNPLVIFFDYDTYGGRFHSCYSWDEGTHKNAPFLWLQV